MQLIREHLIQFTIIYQLLKNNNASLSNLKSICLERYPGILFNNEIIQQSLKRLIEENLVTLNGDLITFKENSNITSTRLFNIEQKDISIIKDEINKAEDIKTEIIKNEDIKIRLSYVDFIKVLDSFTSNETDIRIKFLKINNEYRDYSGKYIKHDNNLGLLYLTLKDSEEIRSCRIENIIEMLVDNKKYLIDLNLNLN